MLRYWFPLSLALLMAGVSNFAYPEKSQPTHDDSSSGSKIYKQNSGSVFTIETNKVDGSAVAVRKDLLATNCHVTDAGNYVKVNVNGEMKDGYLYHYDRDNDLCLVKVPDAQFIPVRIRPSKEIEIGADVYAIGNPDGIERTISSGIISNEVNVKGRFMLQTDAPITFGSSGGGLFDRYGNLIGITEGGLAGGGNIGFAIPSEVLLAQLSPTPQDQNTSIQTSSTSQPNQTMPLSLSSNEPASLTIIGYFGNNNIGLIKWNNSCLITIIGRYGNNNRPENVSLVFWSPNLPNVFIVIPSTADIYSSTKFLSKFLADQNPDIQLAHSAAILDKKIYQMKYNNHLDEKYSVMVADMKGDVTQNLLIDDNFFIQFYQFRGKPGMTTVRFDLDGFTEALSAYNKSCGK